MNIKFVLSFYVSFSLSLLNWTNVAYWQFEHHSYLVHSLARYVSGINITEFIENCKRTDVCWHFMKCYAQNTFPFRMLKQRLAEP
jgi:hypothetical protein